nr:iron-containing alcohol dehydrogenase [Anaerolineae bacterium]
MIKRVWPLPQTAYLPLTELEETRPVALVTSAPAWAAVQARLRLPVVWQYAVTAAEEAPWQAAAAALRGEVVYAVGGGLAVDAAKYIAHRRGLPLIVLPTVLSVDAFFTWAAGVRRDGGVVYLETGPAERVVIDLDVLSIATGLWDWEYAHQQGHNPPHMPFIPWVADMARGILRGALDCAEAAGRGDPDGLKHLLDGLALEVQLCNQIGHSRPEEG